MSGAIYRLGSRALLFVAACAWLTGCPPAGPGIDVENPAGVALVRSAPAVYTPGGLFTVNVTLSADNGNSIKAIGLSETIPAGWQFVSSAGSAHAAPDISPFEGRTGTLGFAWIDIPSFPFSFSYTVLVPADATASSAISGRVDYYQNLGLQSSEVLASTYTRVGSSTNPAALSLARVAPPTFTHGAAFEVTITIDAADGLSITALGLTEMIPEGWTFDSAAGVDSPGPAINPQEGQAGALNFAWINIPEFPYTFRYTLIVPHDAGDVAEISGRVDYYQDLGVFSSDDLVSTFTAAPH